MSDLQSLKTILNEKEIGKTSGKRGLADELGFILGLFSAWKIALFVQTFLALTRFPLGKIDPGFYNLVVGIWAKTWDAGNYLSITKVGYTEQTYAFFPLLPLLTRLVTEVTRLDTAVIGVVIVNLAIFFALFVFYRLLKLDFDELTSRRALFFFLLFPTAFFLQAFYSESLFLLLTLSAFYLTRKGQWFIAVICAGLASLSRFLGVFLLFPLLAELISQNGLLITLREKKRELGSLFLIPLLFSTYLVFLLATTSNPYKFIQVQKDWDRIGSPGQALSPIIVIQQNWATLLSQNNFSGGSIINFLDLIFLISALILLILAIKQGVRLSYLIYAGLCLFLPLVSGSLVSMMRFLLIIFPLFIVLANLAQRSFWNYLIMLVFAFLQAQLVISFIFGLWVA